MPDLNWLLYNEPPAGRPRLDFRAPAKWNLAGQSHGDAYMLPAAGKN